MRVIEPLLPDDVVSTRTLPEMSLDVVIVPLPISVRVPLVDVTAPDVAMVAEPPVVVIEKSPPTVEAARVTAPLLVK